MYKCVKSYVELPKLLCSKIERIVSKKRIYPCYFLFFIVEVLPAAFFVLIINFIVLYIVRNFKRSSTNLSFKLQ